MPPERVLPVTPPPPTHAGPLVGRAVDLAAIRRLLDDPTVRLVTLVGMGGSGKSRLAIEVATDPPPSFDGRVVRRSFRTVAYPSLVLPLVAGALGVEGVRGDTTAEAVGRALGDPLGEEPILFVADDVTHLRDGLAVLRRVLAAAPGLRILATSRRPLGLPGEHVVRVEPLEPPGPAERDPATLAANPAVALFVERARLVRPGFDLGPTTAPAVAAICRHLDGLPLAIELAAASLRVLTPHQLLDRLETHPARPATPAAGRHDREVDLRATMDRSVDLLEPGTRRIYARLGVFAGPFDRETAESVLAAAGMRGLAPLDVPLADGLTELTDASLLRAVGRPDAEEAFAMAGIVREDAAARLVEAGEAVAVRWAHAYALLAVAEASAAVLADRVDAAVLDRLEAVHDDLRAAFDWAQAEGDAAFLLRLAAGLAEYWRLRGHLIEGRLRMTTALQRGSGQPPALRLPVLEGAGALAYRQGDYARAGQLAEEELAIARELGDDAAAAGALNLLGLVAFDEGDMALAAARVGEGLRIRRSLGADGPVAVSLNTLGGIEHFRGHLEAARGHFAESVRIKEARGDLAGRAITLANVGLIERDLGELDVAARTLDEAVAILEATGDRQRAAVALHNRALVSLDRADLDLAERQLEHAYAIAEELGDRNEVANALADAALVALARGDAALAGERARHSLDLAVRLRTKGLVALALEAVGSIAAGVGRPLEAARFWAAAATVRDATGYRLLLADRRRLDASIAAARSASDSAEWDRAWAGGARLTIDDAAAEVLGRGGAGLAAASV